MLVVDFDMPKNCRKCPIEGCIYHSVNDRRPGLCPIVREVKRGEWIPENKRPKSWTFYCSVCYQIAYYPQNHHSDTMPKRCGYAFCPNCGADMRI